MPPSGEQHPTTNIMSHPSKAPPPPLLAGALTVSEADALTELPPAGARRQRVYRDGIGVSPRASRFSR